MQRSISEWVSAYQAGEFDSPDREVQVDAGWTDWFCDDSQLVENTKKLAGLVTRLRRGGKLDLDSASLLLKQGQTSLGTYDSVVFYDAAGPLFTCNADDARTGKKWDCYDAANGSMTTPAFSCGAVTQMSKWLNTKYGERRIGKFEVARSTTFEELKVAAKQHAEQEFGEDVEFSGMQRKVFRDAGQVDVWLDKQLPTAKVGTVLMAVGPETATAGYSLL